LGLGDSVSKSRKVSARRVEIVCAAVMSVAISKQAIAQDQQQKPLPPVTVEAPTARPARAATPASNFQRGKARRARQAAREAAAANAAAAAAAAQQAAAAEAYRTREGSEARGYKPDTVTNFGPFGRVPILDVPYSVNVLSSAFLENRLASTPEDAFKYSPVAQVTNPFGRGGASSVFLRGFSAGSSAIDGMRTGFNNNELIALEDKERVEILTGLTGFLYGGTDVGGMVNYVYKKPTPVPYYSLTVGDYGYLQGFTHLDVGGPIDKEGRFGYRINLVGQDGATPTTPQWEKRGLVTGAFSWNITPDTRLDFVGSHQALDLHGQTAAWIPGGGFDYTRVPDPHRLWDQPWTSIPNVEDRAEVTFSSRVNDIITFRTAYSFDTTIQQAGNIGINFWDDNKGNYDQLSFFSLAARDNTHSAYAFADVHFYTGPIEHKVTTGAYGNFQTFNVQAGGVKFTRASSSPRLAI